MGLGLGEMALPNSLAKAGLVRNSFSMCFQPDNSGRIFFGDKGTASQQTTPFLPIDETHPLFRVALDKISVGSTILDVGGMEIIVDSGTSFTYFPSEAYSLLTNEFDVQMAQTRTPYDPWDFCYPVSNGNFPSLSIDFSGGGNFSVYSPMIGLQSDNGATDAFCLAILEGETAILGQNFMRNYQLIFDHEEGKLGWLPSDFVAAQQSHMHC